MHRWVRQRALRLLSQREHGRHELQQKLGMALKRYRSSASQKNSDDLSINDDVAGSANSSRVAKQLSPEDLAVIAVVLDELEQAGWQSDQRFLESFTHQQAPRMGLRRLVPVLQKHALPPELIEETRQQLSSTELTRAQALWAKRFGKPSSHLPSAELKSEVSASSLVFTPSVIDSVTDNDAAYKLQAKAYVKQMRFLVSRGFSPAIAQAAIKTAGQPLDESLDLTELQDEIDF